MYPYPSPSGDFMHIINDLYPVITAVVIVLVYTYVAAKRLNGKALDKAMDTWPTQEESDAA